MKEGEGEGCDDAAAAEPAAPLVASARLPVVRDVVSLVSGFGSSLTAYAEAAQSALPRGHGVAAEHASNLLDRLKGRVVVHLGHDNAYCGPDRSVDGVLVQTKYCSSGSSCIAECFDERGFRYRLSDGRPMQIEVPRDLYESAVQAMEHRIRKGQVPGITNPADARKIVRRGLLTYRQARRLGRAGSLESFAFDAATGLSSMTLPAGFSATVSLAESAWRGDSFTICIAKASKAGAESAGTTFLTHVLSKQIARTSIDRALTPVSAWLTGRAGPTLVKSVVKAAGRPGLAGAAAANHASKLLRGNIVSAVAAGAVVAGIEVVQLARGKRTRKQAAQNVATQGAGIAGGTAGWMGGVAVAATVGSVVPVIGTGLGLIVGGLLGSFGGGALLSRGARTLIGQSEDAEVTAPVASETPKANSA